MSTLIASTLHINDLAAPQFEEFNNFLASKQDGDIVFTNSIGETYTLIRKDSYLYLTFPSGDYTGDPAVVARFNAYNFAPLSVLDKEAQQ